MPPSEDFIAEQYTGTFVEDLLAQTDRVMSAIDYHIADCDPYLYLGDVKLHLANRVMDEGDVQAWWNIDRLQREFSNGASQQGSAA